MTDQTPFTSDRHRFLPPDPGLAGAVLAMSVRDADLVAERLRTSSSMAQAFGYRDSIRATTEELCESMIASAATASLAGYLRSDDLWRLELCTESSRDGVSICEALDDLRVEISARERDIRRYILSARAHITAKRSISILALALDAVSPASRPDFQTIAGISRHSQDVQGDAQDAAETLDLHGKLPLAR